MDGRRRAAAAILLALGALTQCGSPRPHAGRTQRPTPGRAVSTTKSAPPAPTLRTPTPGAAKLGATTYDVPSDAIVVAPGGHDTAAGTVADPLRTVGAALARAADGATVVLRGGVYRESLLVSGRRVTLQAYPNEAVAVRGSRVVTGWTASGSVWTRSGWAPRFPRTTPAVVQRSHPMANAPDMVFVDGVGLRQVSSLSRVHGRTFFVDERNSRLVIGVDPAQHVVEASFAQVGLRLVDAAGTVVRGLQFERFATPVSSHGAVIDESGGVRFEHDIFTQNASSGLSVVHSTGSSVDHCTFVANGQLGLHAFQASDLVVQSSRFTRNNTELFDPKMEAGGAKLSQVQRVKFDRVLADGNSGNGIWFDVDASDISLVRSEVARNRANGVQIEISSDVVVASVVARDNTLVGFRIIESARVALANSVAFRNRTDVTILEGDRPQDLAAVSVSNTVLFDTRTGSGALLDVQDIRRRASGAEMGVTLAANAYCRSRPNRPPVVAVWPGDGGVSTYARAVDELAAITASAAPGVACDGPDAAAMFVRPAAGDFRLGPDSLARGTGTPLSAPVASALGVAAGTPADPGLR